MNTSFIYLNSQWSSYTCALTIIRIKLVKIYLEDNLTPKSLKIHLYFDLEIPLLGIYFKERIKDLYNDFFQEKFFLQEENILNIQH